MSGSFQISMNIDAGGACQAVTASGVSAQSNIFFNNSTTNGGAVVITPTVDVYIRQGVNPTALATGVDDLLLGGQSYRVWLAAGNRFAVIAVSTGGLVHFNPQG